MLQYLNILSKEDTSYIQNMIFKNRHLWTPRPTDAFTLYTFGACSYMDIGTWCDEGIEDPSPYESYREEYKSWVNRGVLNYDRYNDLKSSMNPFLKLNINDIYQKIFIFLESHLGKEVTMLDDLAYPGFHILTYNKNCELVTNSLHIDDQYYYHMDLLRKKFNQVDDQRFLSFTVAIQMPKNGSGLYIWPIEGWEKLNLEEAANKYMDLQVMKNNLIDFDRKKYEEEFKPEIVRYEEGKIIFYVGNLLHEMMPFIGPSYEDDYRITLQGHGILCDNKWIVYF